MLIEPNKQSGVVTLDSDGTTTDITISAVTLSRAWLICTVRTPYDSPQSFHLAYRLSSPTNIELQVFLKTSTDVVVEWQVIEFTVASGISVQQGEWTTQTTQTINPVNVSSSIVIGNLIQTGGALGNDDWIRPKITGPTTVTTDDNGTSQKYFQVIDFGSHATVQHIDIDIILANTVRDITITALTDYTKAIVIGHSDVPQGCFGVHFGRLSLTSNTNLRFERSGSGKAYTTTAQVVEFTASNIAVQSFTNSFSSGTTSTSTLTPAVTVANSIILPQSTHFCWANSNTATDDAGHFSLTYKITDANTATIERADSSANTTIASFAVIDFSDVGTVGALVSTSSSAFSGTAILESAGIVGPLNSSSSLTVVNYTENTATINNPERGIYRYTQQSAGYSTTPGTNNLTVATLNGYKASTEKSNLIYRYYLVPEFINADINQTFLDNIQTDFNNMRTAGFKCMFRISYSNSYLGEGEIGSQPAQQATKAQILTHISQLAPLISANKDVIHSYQAGFIGIWGEWYYTFSAEFGHKNSIDATQLANRQEVLEAMVDATPEEVSLQMRYPAQKRSMYGTTGLNSGTAYQNTYVARLGFFNDAAFNNWGDQGFYSVGSECTTPVGNTIWNYVANETQYTLMTGENNGLNPCTSGFRTTPANVLSEMEETHWSSINRDYHPDFWAQWTSPDYETLIKNLGYRYILENLSLEVVNQYSLDLTINLRNDGFSRLVKDRPIYIVLKNIDTNAISQFLLASDPRTWVGAVSINETIPTTLNGTFQVYLWLPDKNTSVASNSDYAIRTANNSTWESATGYNDLLTTVKLGLPISQLTGVISSDGASSADIIISGTSAIQGDGALVSSASIITSGDSSLEAIGSLLSTSDINISGIAIVNGFALASSSITVLVSSIASIQATGSLAGTSSTAITGTSSILASGSLVSTSDISITGISSGSSETALTSDGSFSITGTASIQAVGGLVSTSNINITSASTIQATGSLVSTADIGITGIAVVGGFTFASSSITILVSSLATIQAIGSLASTSNVSITGETIPFSTTALNSTGSITTASSLTIQAVGTLLSTASIDTTSTATLVGSGSLLSTSNISITGASIVGGNLFASSSITVLISSIANIQAIGSMASSDSILFTGTATLEEATDYTTASTISVSGVSLISALGALNCTANINLTGSGLLSGSTGISSLGEVVTSGATSISAGGSLSSTSSVQVSNSSTLGALAFISSLGDIVLNGAGLLGTIVPISSVGTVSISSVGNLADITTIIKGFSGDGNVYAVTSDGHFTNGRQQSMKERIRKAAIWGLQNTVKPLNGYYLKFGEVNNETVEHSQRKDYPSVDVIWGDEVYTNEFSGGHSQGVYEKTSDLFIDIWIKELEDMATIKEDAVADIEKYFGTHYQIPDSNGNGTALNCILVNNRHFGTRAEKPRGGISLTLKVYYRQLLINPNIGG